MRIRKSAEERRSEIIESTLRLADKVGPDRLSTGQIAQALDLTQPAIFRHFPTKQDLWKAVAARIGEKFQQRWLAVDRGDHAPLERLRAIIVAQLKLIQSVPAIPAILFSRELHVENKALRKLFGELMKQFHRRLERLVDAGQAQGVMRSDIEAKDVAFLMIGLVQGLVLRWSLSGRSFDLPAEGARLTDVQLAAFAPTSGEDVVWRDDQRHQPEALDTPRQSTPRGDHR